MTAVVELGPLVMDFNVRDKEASAKANVGSGVGQSLASDESVRETTPPHRNGRGKPKVPSNSKTVIDYSELEDSERKLDQSLRSIQSRAMKGAGDGTARDVYTTVINLRKKYNKNKRRNRNAKLNKLKNSLNSMLQICEEEIRRETSTSTRKGQKDRNQNSSRTSSLGAHEGAFVVIPSSGGSKIVEGVSSQLREDLFLQEEEVFLDGDDLDNIIDVEEENQKTCTLGPGNSNTFANSDQKVAASLKENKQKRTQVAKRQQQSRKKPPPARKKWWHSITEDDPITMEPLSKLKYPPFEIIVKSDDPKRPNVVHHFDGKVLAHYIVSTGNFSNPNNRQELTREDCMRLDEYLAINHLPKAKVTDAYDLSKMVRIQSSDRGRANLLQREAAVVMQSLFSFDNPSRSVSRRNQNQSRYNADANNMSNPTFGNSRLVNRVVEQQGGMRVVDGNQWDVVMESTLDDREEFPEMPTSATPGQLHLSASRWGRSNRNNPPRNREAFPALGSTSSTDHPITTSSDTSPGTGSAGATASSSAWATPVTNPGGWNRDSSKALAESLASASVDAFKEKTKERERVKDVEGVSIPSRPPLDLLQRSHQSGVSTATHVLGQRIVDIADSTLLCPFTPAIAELARSLGLNWISQVERKLTEFVRNGPSIGVLTPHFPVMPRKKRGFLIMLCRNYFGLDTVTMDQVSKVPASGEPEVTLTSALMQWGSTWLNPKFVQPTPNSSVYDDQFQCIILYGLQSNRKISNQDIYQALDNICRRSEFAVTWLAQEDVLLEFGDRIIARKVYTRLKPMLSLQNYVRFKQLQWWPCNPSWAVQQMQAKSRSLIQGQRAAKEEKRRLKTAKRLDQERKQMDAKKWNLKSGWDSDDENDKILLREPRIEPKQGMGRKTSNKWNVLS